MLVLQDKYKKEGVITCSLKPDKKERLSGGTDKTRLGINWLAI